MARLTPTRAATSHQPARPVRCSVITTKTGQCHR